MFKHAILSLLLLVSVGVSSAVAQPVQDPPPPPNFYDVIITGASVIHKQWGPPHRDEVVVSTWFCAPTLNEHVALVYYIKPNDGTNWSHFATHVVPYDTPALPLEYPIYDADSARAFIPDDCAQSPIGYFVKVELFSIVDYGLPSEFWVYETDDTKFARH